MRSICIVIPCYNEFNRFDKAAFENYYRQSDVHFYFVNDGSKDATLHLLQEVAQHKERITLVNQVVNIGKAESIRSVMMQAWSTGKFDYIGFWDADFATPLSEIDAFQLLLKPNSQIIVGSRIKRLGAEIERSAFRHYFGRIFATIVTKLFRLPIYDTQCGAKLFHKDIVPVLFKEQFQSKWMFDLELFIRFKKEYGLDALKKNCYEYPLNSWIDVGDSKMKKMDFISVPFRILHLYYHYSIKK